MKTITKHFVTLAQAEQFQNDLYEEYDYVRLVGWPRFEEGGIYAWEVKDK